MNDTDRLSIAFSAVLDSYKRMLRMWQGIAFLLLILSMILASCIAWAVYDSEVQFRPCVGMTITTAVTGKILAKAASKESSLCVA